MKVTPRDMDPKRAPGKHKTGGGSSSEDSNPASPSSSPAAAAPAVANVFANDGSFMEIFKKKMEEEKSKKEAQLTGGKAIAPEQGHTSVEKKAPPVTSFVGKRRGGVFLKTGVVAKKQKQDAEAEAGKSDAWSKYMAEVKKYKAHQCSDDDKTRPLVK
ncbi:telomerase RNA component interacting RNase-like isoform X2 [Girardinichthys multiradiatus]|uniref:telomerase RNA component interacting RNase-like isoform X2 n=1 Tax=Girardinichthys multiradiatus TaxID=208333 RepID=UPI001FACA80D|nr:telomerase RNA component interacting RNase-like isoform X2 [Girardinichthys multiradiatus]XP_047214686.1 telomerase RNA component interacting RNase-like isoform X2 [Girardinichthys multiradiatus]